MDIDPAQSRPEQGPGGAKPMSVPAQSETVASAGGKPPAGRKFLNLALLIGSFAAGQGSIFVVQTILIASGQVELLASFGTIFSFAILFILFVDFGSQTALARDVALLPSDAERNPSIWRSYWRWVIVRLPPAVLAIALAIAYATLAGGDFERWYIIAALPAAVIWAFNATGILDGLRLSGVAGVVGSLPYILSAMALFAARDLPSGEAGALLGGALTLGYILSVGTQLGALARLGIRPIVILPAKGEILSAAMQGGAVFLAMAPGQLYFRFQLLLAATFLGTSGTAMFLYAKQVATAFAQLIGFVRRVELPELVRRLAASPTKLVREAFRAQLLGTSIGGLGSAGMLVVGVAVGYLFAGDVAGASFSVAIMAPTVIAGAIAAGSTQALQAIGQYRGAATAVFIATAVAALVNCGVALVPALAFFAVADVVLSVVSAAVSARLLSDASHDRRAR